jgi:hypothetical protein
LLFSSTKQHKSDPNSFSAGAEDACWSIYRCVHEYNTGLT